MRLLAVDDSMVMRRIIANAAEVLGMETIEAKDGKEALRILEEQVDSPFDIILLDHNMPELKGLDLLEKLKADDRFSGTPVMMVTSEGGGEIVVKAIKAGAANYLCKPFAQEDLLAKIMQCLGQGV